MQCKKRAKLRLYTGDKKLVENRQRLSAPPARSCSAAPHRVGCLILLH